MGWIFLIIVFSAFIYGCVKFIKWIAKPSYIYRWGNDIYISHGELTAEQQRKAKKKLENERKKK